MSDSNGLPRGWATVRFGDLGEWYGGGTPSKSNETFWKDGTIPWVSPKDMKLFRLLDSQDHVSEIALQRTSLTQFPAETILFVVRSGILSRTFPVAICDVPATMNQDLKGVLPHKGILSAYLAYLAMSREQEILRNCSKHGTTVASIDTSRLHSYEIPLAPTNEQGRIVAKIEELFSDLDAGVKALERAKANLKRYRAAVLKAAVEGKLMSEDVSFKSLPLGKLIHNLGQGWSPKCDLNRDPTPDEWAIIKTTAVQSMSYSDCEAKPLPDSMTPRPQLEINQGDMLMTRKGPRKRAGVACLVRSTRPRLMVCDTVYRFQCNEELVDSRYLEIALNSPRIVEEIDKQKAGINDSGVSLTHKKTTSIHIPIPPHHQQIQIIDEVAAQLSVVDAINNAIDQGVRRASRLRQSILKHAFEGKLVPQDPNDEPAEELLARIAAERKSALKENGSPKKKQPRKRKAAKKK